MEVDALGAHARDELGLSDQTAPRPMQAATASAASFVAGAVLPVVAALLTPHAYVALGVAVASLVVLIALGVVGARAGGAPPFKAAIRTAFWGSVAMAVTALIGRAVGAEL